MYKTNKIIAFVVIGVGCVLLLWMLFVRSEVMPPQSRTVVRMHNIARRIIRYALIHNRLPENLMILPDLPEHDNSVTDGWDRDIIYQADPNGDITLVSYGRDGVSGGTGENQDIVGVYSCRNAAGKWNEEYGNWKRDPAKSIQR